MLQELYWLRLGGSFLSLLQRLLQLLLFIERELQLLFHQQQMKKSIDLQVVFLTSFCF